MSTSMKLPTKDDFELAEDTRNGFESWLWGQVHDAIWDTMGSGKRYVTFSMDNPDARKAEAYLKKRLPAGYKVTLVFDTKSRKFTSSLRTGYVIATGVVVNWSDLMKKERCDE